MGNFQNAMYKLLGFYGIGVVAFGNFCGLLGCRCNLFGGCGQLYNIIYNLVIGSG